MRWEYKVVHISAERWTATGLPKDLNERFDAWGADEWELIRIEPLLRGGFFLGGFGSATRTAAFVAVFKRPKG